MAIMAIKKAGDVVLKEKATPVDKIDSNIKKLLKDMAETMYSANGVGLAAPQVGVSKRVIVIDVGEGLFELINPEILTHEGLEIDTEGCLSVPNFFGEVERYAKVSVAYMNKFGKRKHLKAEGLFARCIQHEIDHLNGILFIDVAKTLRREMHT